MKKTIGLLLALVIVVLITGCGVQESNGKTQDPNISACNNRLRFAACIRITPRGTNQMYGL